MPKFQINQLMRSEHPILTEQCRILVLGLERLSLNLHQISTNKVGTWLWYKQYCISKSESLYFCDKHAKKERKPEGKSTRNKPLNYQITLNTHFKNTQAVFVSFLLVIISLQFLHHQYMEKLNMTYLLKSWNRLVRWIWLALNGSNSVIYIRKLISFSSKQPLSMVLLWPCNYPKNFNCYK